MDQVMKEEHRFCDVMGIVPYRYEVYNSGKVFDTENGRFIETEPDLKNGFISVSLRTLSGRYKKFLIHLLVYETFLPEEFRDAKKKKLLAIHKDGNIRNNWLYNIEFGSRAESRAQRKGELSQIRH